MAVSDTKSKAVLALQGTLSQTLETLVIRQLRAILRLPAHLTQTTNQDVALEVGLQL